MGDILQLLDEWTVQTTDGYSWHASVNGLNSYAGEGWIIMVDGHQLAPSPMLFKDISAIPLAVEVIDSVEVMNTPQLHGGYFAGKGLIHIHTSSPKRGMMLHVVGLVGDETGDPGPYRYTDYQTPNVDRIGREGLFTVDFHPEGTYARIAVLARDHTFTDINMRHRIFGALDEDKWANMSQLSSSVAVGIDGARHHGELYLAHAMTSKYLLFFQPLGREVPVTTVWSHAGAAGTVTAGERHRVDYRVFYESNELRRYDNMLDFDFDWKMRSYTGNTELAYLGRTARLSVGAGFERRELDTGYRLTTDSYQVGSVYGSCDKSYGARLRQSGGIMVRFTAKEAALKASLLHDVAITRGSGVMASLSFSRYLLGEGNDLWFWVGRGYGLLDTYGIDCTVHGAFQRSTNVTSDLSWSFDGDDFSVDITGSYRYLGHVQLERQDLLLNPRDCSFEGPVHVFPDESGHTAMGTLALRYHPSPVFSHRLFYSYQEAVAGSERFRAAWESVPHHAVHYSMSYRPVEDFSLWSYFRYSSSSYWKDYTEVDRTICQLDDRTSTVYNARIPSAYILDVQVRKRFLDGTMVGSLLARNLFNREHRLHPAGASFDLSFYVQLQVNLHTN
ncbi:MAG: hypothetical protein JSV33_08050 [bacterium]|nr:MAG: hypothetical protein JSV33_08050 [bacterium]